MKSFFAILIFGCATFAGLIYINRITSSSVEGHRFPWLQRFLAGHGDSEAMSSLGAMYYAGIGVEKDIDESVHWFSRAAEKGNLNAMYNLGYIYLKGEGVAEDPTKAHYWLTRSAEAGNSKAQSILGYMHYSGKHGLLDYEKALKWFQKAAEKGEAKAQYNLGVMHSNGHGMQQNFKAAHMWFTVAENSEKGLAQHDLSRMEKTLSWDEIQRSRESARDYLKTISKGLRAVKRSIEMPASNILEIPAGKPILQ